MAAFDHRMVDGDMSALTIHRPDFTDRQWKDFQQAHRSAYAQLPRFHFVLDVSAVNPAQCSHVWKFAQYLSGEMKAQSERQVASIYIVNQHNGWITAAIERTMTWYQNTIQLHFVDSVDAATRHKRQHYG